MRTFVGIFVLALALTAGAFQIISESPSIKTRVVTAGPDTYTVVEGNTLYTVQCDSSDFGHVRSYALTFPDGASGRFNVSCGTPVNRFKLSLVGYVPEDAILGTIEQCAIVGGGTTSSKRAKTHQTDDEFHWSSDGLAISAKRRPHHYYRDGATRHPHQSKRSLRPMSVWDTIKNVASSAASRWANAYGLGSSNEDCPKCDQNAKDLDRLNARVRKNQEKNLKAMGDFMNQLNDVQGGQADLSRQLAESQSANLDATNGLISSALESINVTGKLQDFQVQQAKQLDAKFAQTEASIGVVSTAVSNLTAQVAALSGSVDAGVRTAMNYTRVGLDNVRQTLSVYQNVTDDRLNNYDRMFNDLSASLQTTYAILTDMQRRDRDRATFTRSVHTLMASLEDDGWNMYLKARGIAPSDDTSAFPFLNIAQVVHTWVSSSTAYKVRMNYNCGTRYLLNRGDLQHDAETIVKNLGPTDCDTADPDTCTCWISVAAQRCTKHGSYSFSSPPAFDNFDNATALGATFCSGAVTTTNSEILSAAALETFWLNGSYAPCASVPMAGTSYAVRELRMAKRVLTYNDPGLCVASEFSLERATSPPSGAPINPYMAMLNFFRMQRAVSNDGLDKLEQYVYGLVPDGLTFESEPFTRRPHPDNSSLIVNAACIKAHFSAYKGVLPMYRMTAFASSTTVTSTVERFLPGGGVQTSAASVKSVLLSAPLENLLPVSGKLVVGNPAATDLVYDVPDPDISAGSVAASNAGAVGYVRTTNLSLLYNQNAFITEYGNVFKADDAVTAPAQYDVVINGSTQTCVLARAAGTGSLCELRDSYSLVSATLNGTLYVLASQRGGFYQAVIDKPDGDLTSLIQSTCPTLSYGELTPAGVTVVLSVTAQLPDAVDARVDVEPSECDSYSIPVTVTPGTSTSVFIEACAFGGSTTMTVSRLGATGYELCPGDPFNVSAPTSEILAAKGIATTGHAVSVSTTNIDQAQVATQAAALEIAYAQAEMLNTLVQVFSGMEIGLPEPSIQALEEAMSRIRATVDVGAINDILGSRQPITTNFTAAANESRNQFIVQKDNMLSRLDNVSASVSSARGILTNFSVSYAAQIEAIAQLRNLSEIYLNATALLYESDSARANATARNLRALAEAIESGDSGGIFGDIFGGVVNGVSGVGRFAQTIVKGGVGVVKDVVKEGVAVVKTVADEAKTIAGGATGGIFGKFGGMVDSLITIIGVVILYKIFNSWYEKRQMDQPVSERELAHFRRVLVGLGITVPGAQPAAKAVATAGRFDWQMRPISGPYTGGGVYNDDEDTDNEDEFRRW